MSMLSRPRRNQQAALQETGKQCKALDEKSCMRAFQGSSSAAKTLGVAWRRTIAAEDEPLFAGSDMISLKLALHTDCFAGVEVATHAEVDRRWPAGG